ncbi:hypothetical protein UG55_100218 [Frankia sp. EI5c]|uniref:AarF/UbiB family protein n=1 Tax=Frankia sp. EI5c TaxID=683316 RepID=UPI0007C2D4C0|nr:AarF/UbiB family protein [Frankia sp. EI5c]OAA29387.1 hypothetical protein UG55_100218 [Frankia sp. EI5c]
MKLPTLLDYQQAVQVPRLAFLDDQLRRSVPRLTPLGMPAVATGGFALTFDVSHAGRRYAVRCFHRHSDNLELRYACIADFVRSSALDFLVGVDYLPAGIRVRDHCWPIVRMEWIDGVRLDDWAQENLDRPARLDRVRASLHTAVAELRRRGAAHGDLQHGNILVLPDASIRLVDYDGMYLPALGALGASERGHRNYQHPDRSNQYDVTLDRFAQEVIAVSLAALARDPGLWREFNTGENLILSAADFADPASSALFARLERMPTVGAAARRLRDACLVDYEDAAAILDAEAHVRYEGAGRGGPVHRRGRRPAAGAAGAGGSGSGVSSPGGVGRGAAVGVVSTVSAARYLRTRPLRAAPLAGPAGLAAPTVLSALDRAGLLARRGAETMVVGRVVRVRQYRRTGAVTVLDFGNGPGGGFHVVGWDRVSRELVATYGDLMALEGAWVRVTGQIAADDRGSLDRGSGGWAPPESSWSPSEADGDLTRPARPSRPAGVSRSPRLELRRGSLLRVLTEREAGSLLHRPGTVPAAPATRSAFGSGPVLPPRRPVLPPPVPGPAAARPGLWPGWS